MRILKIASMAVLLVAAAGLASATPVSYNLLDLIQQNGTVQSGDKTFSNFAATINAEGGVTTPSSLSGITVTPISMGSLFGLQLSGGMSAICVPATCPAFWDLNISWDVTAANPYLIDGVYLSFNGIASNNASLASITETIQVGASNVGTGFVAYPNPMSIFIPLNGAYQSIRITKDILLVATVLEEEQRAFASLSDVDQYYHQVVPEPGTYALIGAGLLGLGLLRRRIS